MFTHHVHHTSLRHNSALETAKITNFWQHNTHHWYSYAPLSLHMYCFIARIS